MEQAEDLAGVGAGGRGEFRLAGRQRVASFLEQSDIVLVILALGTRRRLRQEISGAAAEEDIRLHVEQHAVDVGLVAALAGVGNDGSRRGVLQFGGRDDADRLLGLAAQGFRDRFDLRIVERGRGAVGINANGVHGGLVTGHVG
ncbi:hypothetical protein D3C72_1810690 [compost metagenome]